MILGLFLGHGRAGAESETTPTLTLGSILRTNQPKVADAPSTESAHITWPTWREGAPPFRLPPREWFEMARVAPGQLPVKTEGEPKASSLPDDIALPYLPPRGFGEKNTEHVAKVGLLHEVGRDIGLSSDWARVVIDHRGEAFVTEWRLRPAEGKPENELVFQLPPGRSETLLLKPGMWEFERRIPFPDSSARDRIDRYPKQDLLGGWDYETEMTLELERAIGRDERWRTHFAPQRIKIEDKK